MALESAIAIADSLAADKNSVPFWHNGAAGRQIDPSLATGTSGLGLFLAETIAWTEREQYIDPLVSYVRMSVEAVARQHLTPGLYRGVTGVGWALHQIASLLPENTYLGNPEAIGAIDGAVERWLQHPSWSENVELIYGAIGLGVYALARMPRDTSRAAIRLVLHHLERGVHLEGDTVTWVTEAHPEYQVPAHVNLGHAHGVSGIIAFLATLCLRDIEFARASALLRPAVRWLVARRLPSDGGGLFPPGIRPDRAIEGTMLGWCYGDLTVAIALGLAGEALQCRESEEHAREIARYSASRGLDSVRQADLSVCHGYAGVAHLFSRLHAVSGDEECRSASERWLSVVLSYRDPTGGIGGFPLLDAEDGSGPTGRSLGLLTGVAGIGLVLLAAGTTTRSTWDQALLISV